jgi:hypothetical protein
MHPLASAPFFHRILWSENRFPLFGMMLGGHWVQIEREAAFLSLVPEFLKRA